MEYRYILKEAEPSRNSWRHPRTEIPTCRKVGYSTDAHVTGWNVMKCILANLPEHLVRGLKNISMLHHPYITPKHYRSPHNYRQLQHSRQG